MTNKKEMEMTRLQKITLQERKYWDSGTLVGGMDEVGRGPLAGPVVVCGVCMPGEPLIEGVNDSKKLSKKRREALFIPLCENAVSYGIGIVSQEDIDEINILNATKKAFALAFEAMPLKPKHMLIDALTGLDIAAMQYPIIHGDALSYSIAAASIIAKVTRDRMMVAYDKEYPQYGFSRNKGYGTAEHIAALCKYGPCPLHRKTFIKKFA